MGPEPSRVQRQRQRRREGIWKGNDKGKGKGKGVCYKYGHAGHMARDCPDSRPFQDNCTACGHWGHTAKFCWAGRIEEIGQDAGAQRGRGYAPAGSRPGQGDCTSEETLIPLSMGVPWRNPPTLPTTHPTRNKIPGIPATITIGQWTFGGSLREPKAEGTADQ